MTARTDTTHPDAELKARHRAMWALGDYPSVAADLIPHLGASVVAACDVRRGDTVLDVACGSGNAALPAARRGADVTACDLTPTLLDAGRALGDREGLPIRWQEGDAESLPFPDGSFDVVVSTVGVMFAPHHQASADELLRVCRPGGRIGLASWTAEGFVGQMLAVMRPFSPPPAPGAQSPLLWGDEDHVRTLFGDRLSSLATDRRAVTVDRFATPDEFRDYVKWNYGPTVATYRGIAGTPERVADLDRELSQLAVRHDRAAAGSSDGVVMDWEYLQVVARRPG